MLESRHDEVFSIRRLQQTNRSENNKSLKRCLLTDCTLKKKKLLEAAGAFKPVRNLTSLYITNNSVYGHSDEV